MQHIQRNKPIFNNMDSKEKQINGGLIPMVNFLDATAVTPNE